MLPFSEGDGGLPAGAEVPKTFIWSNYNDVTPLISARGVANWKGHPFISETFWFVLLLLLLLILFGQKFTS